MQLLIATQKNKFELIPLGDLFSFGAFGVPILDFVEEDGDDPEIALSIRRRFESRHGPGKEETAGDLLKMIRERVEPFHFPDEVDD